MNQHTDFTARRSVFPFRKPRGNRRLVDPALCHLWSRHNRDYARLNAENCADLIEGLKAQGKQEFPAIVRETGKGYEIITGARRHWAVTWLRANGHPDFRYLVEVRTLTDEQAFRLADIENRHRKDISDYERAKDYAQALAGYYNGKQKDMAEALEVSADWLSRYLDMAKLPDAVVSAFADETHIRVNHVRLLKPLLNAPKTRTPVLEAARDLAKEQKALRAGNMDPLDAAQVMSRLRNPAKRRMQRVKPIKVYRRAGETEGIAFRKKGETVQLEFPDTMSRASISEAFRQFMEEHFPSRAR